MDGYTTGSVIRRKVNAASKATTTIYRYMTCFCICSVDDIIRIHSKAINKTIAYIGSLYVVDPCIGCPIVREDITIGINVFKIYQIGPCDSNKGRSNRYTA